MSVESIIVPQLPLDLPGKALSLFKFCYLLTLCLYPNIQWKTHQDDWYHFKIMVINLKCAKPYSAIPCCTKMFFPKWPCHPFSNVLPALSQASLSTSVNYSSSFLKTQIPSLVSTFSSSYFLIFLLLFTFSHRFPTHPLWIVDPTTLTHLFLQRLLRNSVLPNLIVILCHLICLPRSDSESRYTWNSFFCDIPPFPGFRDGLVSFFFMPHWPLRLSLLC